MIYTSVLALLAATVAIMKCWEIHNISLDRAREVFGLEADVRLQIDRLEYAEDRHTIIEKDMREQIQNLAQRLATVSVNHPGAISTEDRFEPKPEPPKPYSQALRGFLDMVQFEDSRMLIEEEIERYRAEGIDDAQILQLISEGGTI